MSISPLGQTLRVTTTAAATMALLHQIRTLIITPIMMGAITIPTPMGPLTIMMAKELRPIPLQATHPRSKRLHVTESGRAWFAASRLDRVVRV